MSTIRPPIFPTPQPQPQATAPVRNPAQRAFFEAAMGRPAAAQAQVQAQAPAAPAHRMPAALPDEPPQKILRPGSLLDIRV
ncbi:hypothetical protein ASE17_14150 [Phenylobacterium sp. Root77]|uniref:hypothetical protein n=1 Tax=unclassified Phenylobacterium TaxID=2640670 RepID=UPI0006FA3296|nr:MULTISPECIES: hypothetical protein [unclassified Phenylobacterium]KQW65951.1 hypothetical protein ASC73_19720 [Phenylobacterium sp. Root1277]KQW95660.1 hypothetical protein ASC79_08200 [Phenylobacterium sp. Root1290]KRC41449.1 hypothetical protein ASE17_14150 [Phenylobacterium sp. Root77]